MADNKFRATNAGVRLDPRTRAIAQDLARQRLGEGASVAALVRLLVIEDAERRGVTA